MSLSSDYQAPKVERSGNVTIFTFMGGKARDVANVLARELDGKELEGRFERFDDECHLLLDFSNVEYLNSSELGTLISLHKRMKASGGRLTLFNLSADVYEVFAVTRLQTVLGICREETMVARGQAGHNGRPHAAADDDGKDDHGSVVGLLG